MTAFDRAWDTVKFWADWEEDIVDLRSPEKQMQLPADKMPIEGEGTEPTDDLVPQRDTGDACCANIRQMYASMCQELRENGLDTVIGVPNTGIDDFDPYPHHGEWPSPIEFIMGDEEPAANPNQGPHDTITHQGKTTLRTGTQVRSLSCDDFRELIEQFVMTGGMTISPYHMMSEIGSGNSKINPEWTKAELGVAQQCLKAWDECIQEITFDSEGDNTVDMHMSDDPFEAGWGHIAKKHWGGW